MNEEKLNRHLIRARMCLDKDYIGEAIRNLICAIEQVMEDPPAPKEVTINSPEDAINFLGKKVKIKPDDKDTYTVYSVLDNGAFLRPPFKCKDLYFFYPFTITEVEE